MNSNEIDIHKELKKYFGFSQFKGLQEKVIKSINTFLDSFDSLSIVTYDVKSLAINKEEEDACVDFHICYRGVFDGTAQYVEYKGDGSFKLHPSEYGGWSIYQIDLQNYKFILDFAKWSLQFERKIM